MAESASVKIGLQYLRTRYYGPETGTFITEQINMVTLLLGGSFYYGFPLCEKLYGYSRR